MRARVSRISLILYAVMVALSSFLLSVAGDYWPWYAAAAIFAVVPLLIGPRRYRLWGAAALTLAALLIASDIAAGMRIQRMHQEVHLKR